MPPQKKPPKSLGKVATAGAIAGSMEIVVTYPLEFAKTHLQLQHSAAGTGSGFNKGVVDCLRTTVRNHGPRGVYQGCASWFVFAGPRSAVRFAVFEHLSKDAPRTPMWDFLCGLGAGTFEAALCQTQHPVRLPRRASRGEGCHGARRGRISAASARVEGSRRRPNQSIQIKLQHDAAPTVQRKLYSHLPFPSAVLAIARHHGILSFYDGLAPAVAKGALTNSVRFVGYKGLLRVSGRDEDPSPLESFAAGACAGAVSAVVSQPVDTVKANMMGLDRARYASSLECARAIVRADGWTALFNGVRPRVVRVFFEVGLQFALFEQVSKVVDKLW